MKTPDSKHEMEEASSLALEGGKLSSEQVQELEQLVRQNPAALVSRTKLLGYYFTECKSEQARGARRDHIGWIIQTRTPCRYCQS